MSSVDIVEVLTRTIEASRPAFAARHQRLTKQLPPGPLLIQADAVRVAQIFGNLLDTASRYTPEGGEISLTGELTDDSVVIIVSDNGMGISPGIGLAVVHDLVEAHGGTVVARSRGENLGSELSVTLPTRRGTH